MPALDLIAWLFATIAIVPLSILIAELLAGQRTQRDETLTMEEWPTSVVVMPAHNEASIIGETVRIMLDRLAPNSSLLVIADNCADETARLAQEAGATVAVRNNPAKRGKGYALAYATEVICESPPDLVIILDADCQVSEGSLSKLVAAAAMSKLPVQSSYVMVAPDNSPPIVQISNFAFYIKNVVRQRGMDRLGRAALLTGTGIALSWEQFRASAVPSGEIVEDLVMGISLTKNGQPPKFLDVAKVESFAAGQGDTLSQRQRWEHGFIAIALKQALPCLWSGATQANWPLFWTGLHLLVPPLVMLMLVCVVLLAGQIGLAFLGASIAPFLTIASLLAVLFALLSGAWFGGGSTFLSAQAVLNIPNYLAWKLPMYKKFFGHRQNVWNRTPRDGE